MKYVVSVLRTSSSWRDIEVEADSEVTARHAALAVAGDYTYSEKDAEYSAEEVRSV